MLNQSATRYVKKVSANPEMSHNKLIARVKENSDVLEFGPASGAMTKVMHDDLNCKISIVEIDEECFQNAMQYAESGVCGNIETFGWVDEFSGKKFDYIIFADVLEHLLNPEKVLVEAKKLLKDDGSILISLPNIAHNSVIIQLLNNQFIYQSTGILDFTHVRHFTFNEVEKMCISSGYGVVYMDGVYIAVGKNEFDVSYADVAPEIAEALRKRPLGELYQHILEIKKSEYVAENDIKIENCIGKFNDYTSLYLQDLNKEADDNSGVNREVIEAICCNPNKFFVNNDEVAKLRLELNELYLADPERNDILELKKQLSKCYEETKSKDNRIVALQNAEEDRNNHIKTLDEQINTKDARILELQAEVEEKNARIKELVDDIDAKLEQQISQYEEKVKGLEQQIEEEKANFQQTLRNKEGHIELLLESERRLNNEVANLQQIIRNKEGHIELLLESERAAERERNSRTYKLAKKMQKVIQVLFPADSLRRFFVRVMGDCVRHPIKMLKVIGPKRMKSYFAVKKTEGMAGVRVRYMEAKLKAFNIQTEPQEAIAVIPPAQTVAKTIQDYEKFSMPTWENPTVSIVIPVYNQFDYTYECLKSIRQNSGDVSYEILIANDCSTDITKDIEKIVENVKLITTKENVRFLLNCNNAAKQAKGKYILFLNNDTQVKENWLEPLVSLIERDDTIGMVGSKLVYPDGTLQEAGGIVWKDASAWNYGNRKDPEDPEFNYVKEADYISGAAIMIKHSLWKELGGFDERFAPAYYEDTDLAFQVRAAGYKVMYQPLSVVVHFEGVSNGTDVSTGLKHYQQVNFEKFYEKWKDVLEAEHEVNAENVFTAKDRSNHKKHILVVDHYVPHHDQDAGGKCTYMYLQTFVKMGFKVTFIGDNFFKHEPYTTQLNQFGIEVLYGNYYYNNWQQWLKDNAHYFDYIYLQRPHISVKYIDLVKEYSNAKILYFAHDLHHIREYREYEMTQNPEKLESSQKWKKIEYELFEKSDVGHVVGSFEQKVMQDAFPNKPIRNIPLYIYEQILTDINKNFSERNDLLYVGGFGHPPNIDAVLWFAKEIFPSILKKYPDMKWHVVGGKVPPEIQELASDNIIIEGFVSDEVLEQLYRKCRLAVVPLRFGAGVKGKVVEAGYFQIPLITTSIGAEGLTLDEGSMLVEDDADKMAALICDIYEDYDRLRTISDNAVKFIENHFTLKEAERVLRLDIDI